MILKRMAQVVAEDEYSRRNIREKVYEAVTRGAQNQLQLIFDSYCEKVEQWCMDESKYDSKDHRKIVINSMDPEEVVTELFIAVLSETGITPIQAITSKLGARLGFDDVFDGVIAASEIIGVCWDKQLYLVHNDPLRITPNFQLPLEVREFIANTQYMNPMLCEPEPWTSNHAGGYLTICQHVVLGRHNNHQEKQALDALNIIQGIEWELDENVLAHEELPKHKLDTQEKIDAWDLHIKMSQKVYAEMNSFYFPWKPDFRGRFYSQGHYINLQSTAYKKAMLNFVHKEVIV